MQVKILDSTLRDGAQAEGISFSVMDKLKIVSALDELGIHYIEAGNPGSNPKDLEFFEKANNLSLKNSKLCAFGSTRRANINAEDDENIKSLLKANTSVIVIFGKSWDFHVEEIIKTTLLENLNMIKDTVKFFKEKGKEVIYDAEHFFDGYKANPDYAIASLIAAEEGGADSICLCETNGGAFPDEVFEITKKVMEKILVPIGIHTHNDTGMAEANSIFAVMAGASCVQGTLVGFGERCGNANLSTIIPSLQIKKGYEIIGENISKLTEISRKIAEIANIPLRDNMPYVGKSAFTHKAGMHIDGVNKASKSFEHIPPDLVGNDRRILMSEVAGRSTVAHKIAKIDSTITKNSPITQKVVDRIKELEHMGYQFEGAEAAFELLVRKELGQYTPFFDLEHFKIMDEHPLEDKSVSSSAVIKIKVDNKLEITAAEGDGPVNALDLALRKALYVFYPSLKNVHLTDYKVRVLDSKSATAAKVRVLIESTDGESYWTTVGVSTDIIEASWIALVDSIEYKLLKDKLKK